MAIPARRGLFRRLSKELWAAAMLLLVLPGAIASPGVVRSASTQAPAGANLTDLLQQIGDGLNKLGNLRSALDQVRQGKTPTYGTAFGEAADNFNKYAEKLDALNSLGTTGEVKPPPHKPGSALIESEKHLEDLRSQRQQLLIQQQEISRQLGRAQRMYTAADRLKELLSKAAYPGTTEPYIIDSDQLWLALSSCIGSLKNTESRINSEMVVLTQRISNLDANLKNPRIRDIIRAIDSSSATLNAQVSGSIQTTKSEIANRDHISAVNVQATLHPHPQSTPPAARPEQSTPNMPFPPSLGSNCPPGYQEMNGHCISFSMQPTYPAPR